jgi:ketosteroid isomerase-like protein
MGRPQAAILLRMPEPNVDLVRAFIEGGANDLVAAAKDDLVAEEFKAGFAQVAHPDFECVMVGPDYDPTRNVYPGVDGLVEAWRDWLDPWSEFSNEVEEILGAGDHVVALVRQHGRTAEGGAEVEEKSAVVFTFRDGKVLRMECFYDRTSALKSVGLDPAVGK